MTGVTLLGTWGHCSSVSLIGYLFSPEQIALNGQGTEKSSSHPTLRAALLGFIWRMGPSVSFAGDGSCPDTSLLLPLQPLCLSAVGGATFSLGTM